MLERFIVLLQQIIDFPDADIAQLDYHTQSEKELQQTDDVDFDF